MFDVFADKIYYLIPFPFLICIVFYLSSRNVKSNKVLFPVINMAIILLDIFFLIKEFKDFYFNSVIFSFA